MSDGNESKFNFTEDEAKKQSTNTPQDPPTAKSVWQNFTSFLYELLDFREDTDRDATIEAIKADIPFKGATSWILICSIMVASIGLNANSTAVVIGAMLISPLMGPILGIGLSIAINDIDTLRRSLINLATMIVLSLITAFLFFKFFPLSQDTNELLGRTSPDIRDVLIAFFGGLALIIARTKKGTIASVIFGVAIATALMPPLCTAGYGLAKGNMQYFLGAMYLFTINTIFIALATFLVLKVLRFPMLKYVNSARRRRIAQLASVLAIIVMIPAIFTFLDVYRKSNIDNSYQQFLKDEVVSNNSLWLQREKLEIDDKTINLFFNGDITDATITDLQNEMKKLPALQDFTLNVNANKSRSVDKVMEAYDRAIANLDQKDNIISGLQKEIEELKVTINGLNQQLESTGHVDIPFSGLAKDAKIRFNNLQGIGFGKILSTRDFIKIDTVPVATLRWDKNVKDSLIGIQERDLQNWLKQNLKLDTLIVRRVD